MTARKPVRWHRNQRPSRTQNDDRAPEKDDAAVRSQGDRRIRAVIATAAPRPGQWVWRSQSACAVVVVIGTAYSDDFPRQSQSERLREPRGTRVRGISGTRECAVWG